MARHYGAFLASVQVIPGNMFVETTGSSLANDGVPEAKKIVKDLLNAGGGTLFVDEAYQLTNGQNFGGNQVLDYLLAEMENNVGKIVFIFAGYNREMERFFVSLLESKGLVIGDLKRVFSYWHPRNTIRV